MNMSAHDQALAKVQVMIQNRLPVDEDTINILRAHPSWNDDNERAMTKYNDAVKSHPKITKKPKKTIGHIEWLRIMNKTEGLPDMTRDQLQHIWMTKFPAKVRKEIKDNLRKGLFKGSI